MLNLWAFVPFLCWKFISQIFGDPSGWMILYACGQGFALVKREDTLPRIQLLSSKMEHDSMAKTGGLNPVPEILWRIISGVQEWPQQGWYYSHFCSYEKVWQEKENSMVGHWLWALDQVKSLLSCAAGQVHGPASPVVKWEKQPFLDSWSCWEAQGLPGVESAHGSSAASH